MEEARRGNVPGFHILAPCSLPTAIREIRIVDIRRIFSLPVGFVRKEAEGVDARLRLLPPYRAHLAQAFARFFMRIGLPLDIPPFRQGIADQTKAPAQYTSATSRSMPNCDPI